MVLLVEIIDPYASSEEFEKEYGFQISLRIQERIIDAIIVAVAHKEYI